MNIFKKIVRKFYRKFHLYQTKLNQDYKLSKNLFEIDLEILEKIKLEYPQEFTDRKYNIFNDRINDGGYVLIVNNQIVAYGWIAIDKFYEGSSGYSDTLNSDTIYLYDLYTFNDFKRKGYMNTLIQSIFNTYKQKGYTQAKTIVDNDNIASKHLMAGFNFYPIKEIVVKYFNGKKYIKSKDLND